MIKDQALSLINDNYDDLTEIDFSNRINAVPGEAKHEALEEKLPELVSSDDPAPRSFRPLIEYLADYIRQVRANVKENRRHIHENYAFAPLQKLRRYLLNNLRA